MKYDLCENEIDIDLHKVNIDHIKPLANKGKDDENLRITFDSNLRSREDDLRLELGDHGEKYFDEDMYIMEIKTLGDERRRQYKTQQGS